MDGPVKDIGVIGGGLAGLAVACLLAQRGHAVTVYERDLPGGKMRRVLVGDLRFDTGPSLFTFPDVWRLFLERLGEADPLKLRRLPEGLGVYHTRSGAVPLPVPRDHPLFKDWSAYSRAVDPLRSSLSTLLTTPTHLNNPAFLRASRALLGVVFPHLSARNWIEARHLPDALAQAISTHALNAGLAPQDAAALYALIPALVGQEVYRPARGMGALLGALLAFAQARRVQVRQGTPARRVTGANMELDGGEVARHDLLISAIDPTRLAALRGKPASSSVARRTVSGLAIYAALAEAAPLPPTSVIPPSSFTLFRNAVRAGHLPPNTLALVHADHRKLAVLLTVPATGEKMDTGHPWVAAQLGRLEQTLNVHGLLDTAQDIAVLDSAYYALGGHPGGAIYGTVHPAWRSGPFHPQPYRLSETLWQVGTGVHPGGGIPAILGGALIVDHLLRESGT